MGRSMALLTVLGLIAGCSPEAMAPEPPGPPGTPTLGRWSDPAAWPGNLVPAAGDSVMIPAGRRILLDVSPPVLRSLTIEGALQFDERDLSLTAGWIMVHGTLQVGTEARPYRKRAVITLNGPATDDFMGMGARFLGVMGGTLELHGEPRVSWTRLDASAAAAVTSLTLAVNTDWRAGDRIAIASTDLDPFQAEEAQVASVQGRTVTLTQPLRYNHWGACRPSPAGPWTSGPKWAS